MRRTITTSIPIWKSGLTIKQMKWNVIFPGPFANSKYAVLWRVAPWWIDYQVWDMSTHLPLAPHICFSKLGQDWFRLRFVTCSVPNHYLNQHWLLVNWTIRNKFQWNLNQLRNKTFHSRICIWKYILRNCDNFVPGKIGKWVNWW